jgi:hypothetical protein
MKTILPLIAALFLAGGLAQAADTGKAAAAAPAPAAAAPAAAPAPAAEKKLTSSQQRMTDCNKEAGGKKGTERQDFMRQCMHGGSAPATPPAKAMTPQQNKMKECNKQAGEKALKGDERKAFMSNCLKAK